MGLRSVGSAGVGPVRIVTTFAKRGLLAPGSPRRQVAQLAALATWRMGLAGEVRQAAARGPKWVAVVDEDRGEVTYAELLAGANRVTAWLSARGVAAGERVGLLARNHVGAIEVMVGASALGVDLVLLNTGLSAEQMGQVATAQELSLIIHDDEFASVLSGAEFDQVTTVSESQLAAALGGEHLVRTDVRRPERSGRTIVLTSGTTGVPKGAARKTPGGVGPLVSIIDRIPIRARDRIFIAAPIFHTWGYAALQLSIGMQGTIVLHRRFDPARVRKALETQAIDVLFAVPIMLQRMMELPSDALARTRRPLRVVATSGSAYPSGFTTKFMDEFGDVLYNLYGSTEASWICIATPKDLRRHPDTAGTPPLGTRVAALDAEGRPVPEGEIGAIYAGNDMVFEGYTGGGGKPIVDGMIATGDVGHVSDGLWFVDGRDDDMIVSGGENVYPSEVEAVLHQHDAVREACVVGVPDPEFGQRLAAFVVLGESGALDADGVKALVKSRAARHAVPREVHFLDRLPRNATGKVLARELRARITD